MTSKYANALVQRYMRSSEAGGDTSDNHSSPSPQSAAAARASRARAKTVASAGKHVAEGSNIERRASTATITQQRPLKRDSSVAKRASSLIRAADSSSDDEQVHAPIGRRASSPSFAKMPQQWQQQQQLRASVAAGREPSKSAAGGQSILQRRSSHTNAQREQQLLAAPRASSPPHSYNSGGGMRTNSSSQVAAAASDSGRAVAGAQRQSLVDARAEQLVASYYPYRTMSPASRSASPAVRSSQTLPADYKRFIGSTAQGRQPARSLAYAATGFGFPTNLTSSNEGPILSPRQSTSMVDWQQQDQRQQTMSAAAATARLLPVPPSQSLPPPGVLSPRSSAMQAMQRQGRRSAARSDPASGYVQHAIAAGAVAINQQATAPASVHQQLHSITSSAAAAIERARRITAAAAAGAEPVRRISAPAGSGGYGQQAPGIANLGGPGLPPPNAELAREAAERVKSTSPGRRGTSPGRPSVRQLGSQLEPPAVAEDGSSSDSGVEDAALRDIPGYGNRSRSRNQAAQRQQGQTSSPDSGRRLSATAEATAEAMAAAAAALGGRRSSHQLAPEPSELAAGVASHRMSSAFAAAQAAAEEAAAAAEAEAAHQAAAAAVALHQMPGSSSLAAVRQEAVAASRAAKRASLFAQQAAAEEAELYEQQVWQQQQQQQGQPSSAAPGSKGHHSGSSCSGSGSDEETSEQQGDAMWRQVKRSTRQGWFQSPERLRRNQQQQQHHAALPPGRYISPTRASRWTPWYEEDQPQQHHHHQQKGQHSPVRMHFKLPADVQPSGLQDAAAAFKGSHIVYSGSRRKKVRKQQRHLPGEKLYKQLLCESIEQPLDMGMRQHGSGFGRTAGASYSSREEAAGRTDDSGSTGDQGPMCATAEDTDDPPAGASDAGAEGADVETSIGHSAGDSDPSLRPLARTSKQQRRERRHILEQQREEEQRRRERKQRRRAATAAALQAAYRAASPERRQSVANGRASPDVVGTAIEAATASAAAAEVVRHAQQQKQQTQQEQQMGPPAANIVRPASSLISSPQLRKEVAEEALHRARLAQLLAGGTREMRLSTAGTPYTDASRGRRYARPSTSQSPTPAAAARSSTALGRLGSTSGDRGYQLWQYRSLSAGRQYDEQYNRQYNISPPRLATPSAAGTGSEAVPRSSAAVARHYRGRDSVRGSTELYARPASSMATFNVQPPGCFSTPAVSTGAGTQSNQHLRGSFDRSAVHSSAGVKSITDSGWQHQQQQHDQHELEQQQRRHFVQPLTMPMQQTDTAPTVQSVAENLHHLMQRVADTLGAGAAEAVTSNVSLPARHHQNTPVSPGPSPLKPNMKLRPEDIRQWPVEPRNMSPGRASSPTRQLGSGRGSPSLLQQRQQQLPAQPSAQEQAELSFELSYADNLRQQGSSAMLMQASSSNMQQQQQVELVAPLNYVPRHKMIDAAVTGRPPSQLWNQMHVAQRRLHELQQEQQAVLLQLQQRRSASPSQQQQQQQQHELPGQHVSSGYNFAAHGTPAQAVSAAAERHALAPAPSPPAHEAADWASVGAAADRSGSKSATGNRNRASLIPVEELVAAMRVLQQAIPQQQSPGQQQQLIQVPQLQQQQQKSLVSQVPTAMHSDQLPSSQPASTAMQSPAQPAPVQECSTPNRVPNSQSPSRVSAPLSPSGLHGRVLGAQSQAANSSSPAGPDDLRGLLAGVVGSVQGLDTMMSSLLEAARARSPSKWQQQSSTAASSSANIAAGGVGMPQPAQQMQGVDEGDTVNLGSVLPPHRYRQLNTGSISPDQQQLLPDVAGEGSPEYDAAVAQTPAAAVATAAASVRQVMDQLRSSALAAWQADDAAAAAAGFTTALTSPQQQQPESPAVQHNSRTIQMHITAGASSPDRQAAVSDTAAVASTAAAAAASASNTLHRQEQGEAGGLGGILSALRQSAAIPAELMQQLGALEAQLLAVQQQMLSQQQQQQQQQQATATGLCGTVQPGQQQLPNTQVQQLAEQLTQLQNRLLAHLTCNSMNSSAAVPAAGAVGQHGLTATPLQQQQQQQGLADAPAVQQLRRSLEAVVALSHRPNSSASIQSPRQRSHATDQLASPLPSGSPAPSPSWPAAAAAAAAATTPTAAVAQSVNQWPEHTQATSPAAVRKPLAGAFAGAAAASALRDRQAGSVQSLELRSPERTSPVAAAAAGTTAAGRQQQVSQGVSPICSPGRHLPQHQQQQQQLVDDNAWEQQQQQEQQAALQSELLQASAEAQLVMTQQVNELHTGLSAAATDLRSMQQRLQLLEVQQQQQQQPVQELLLQTHTQQQQLQHLQQQLVQLQQTDSSAAAATAAAAAVTQQEWLQLLQNQIQDLQHQQASTALLIEQQAAAIAEAAGAERQLEPVKEQLQKLEKAQQELLEGSRALCESALQDKAAGTRVDALEGRLAQQQDAVEALRQQLAELRQQQQEMLTTASSADGPSDGPSDGQQQQQRLLQETVEQLKQQLGELQQKWVEQQQQQQQQQQVRGAAAAAAKAEASASELTQMLQQQVQQLELKVAQLQVQQQQHTNGDAIQQVAELQQQLQLLGSCVEQLQQQQQSAVNPNSTTEVSQAAAAAAAECDTLRQQLQLLDQRVDEMSHQLHEGSAAAAITLPLRMTEVEERVAATAQTCADAVKVIALKHASISAMFAEVQASQAAADSRLAQLSKQLSSMRERRGSRTNSRAASGSGTTGVVM